MMNIKTLIVPKELEYLLNKEKRKDSKNRILKIYNALLYKKGNINGYFPVPSSYLKKINLRYYKVIQDLIDYNIIEFLSYSEEEKWENLYDGPKFRKKKFYNTQKGICARYKFLIDVNSGIEYNIEIESNLYDNEKWYHKTKYSLHQLGFSNEEIHIKRDNFSRRLHTNVTGSIQGFKSYRELMKGGEYYSIDSKTSQPRLLWLKLKEMGLSDDKLDYIFENNIDFYDFIIEKIPAINDRDDAKELFASWLNGTGYLEEDKVSIRNIFPVANMLIKSFKKASYKGFCQLIQHMESQIFIDELLNDVPVDFCLSVHDSLLVKKEDIDKVLEFCKERRPELVFVVEEIKNK